MEDLIKWEEQCLGNDLDAIRENQKDIFKNIGDNKITVLAQQPGIGKTTLIIDFLKKIDLKCAIIVPYHKLARSEYTELPNITHWQGFKHICPRYEVLFKQYGNLIENLPKKGFLCKYRCNEDHKTCPYYLQFKEVKQHVITVPEFLNIDYFDKQNFDLIILDESIERGTDLEFEKDKVMQIFKIINEELYEKSLKLEFELIFDLLSDPNIYKYIKNDKDDLFDSIKKLESLKKQLDKLKELMQVNFYDLQQWFFYNKIYNLDIGMVYKHPHIYNALKKKQPIVISDATFNKDFFNALYNQYCKENGLIDQIKVKIYHTDLEAKNLEITRLYKNNMFYKNNLGIKSEKIKEQTKYYCDRTNKNFQNFLKILDAISGKYSDCGLITYPVYEEDPQIPPQYEFLGIGNTLGLNTFVEKKLVFICGIHLMNDKDYLDEYNKLFRKAYEVKDFIGHRNLKYTEQGKIIIWEKSDEDKIIIEKNNIKLPLFLINPQNQKMKDDNYGFSPRDYAIYKLDSTTYQNIHRSRFLIKDVEIYVMGYIPWKIYEEIKVRELGPKASRTHIDTKFNNIRPYRLSQKIYNYYHKNPNAKADEVAKSLNLRTGSRYNTKIVTAIKEHITLGKVQVIDKCVKEGLINPPDIIKKHPALKNTHLQKNYDIETFIADLIKYSK